MEGFVDSSVSEEVGSSVSSVSVSVSSVSDSGGRVSSVSVSDVFFVFVFLVVSSLFFEHPAREMTIVRVRRIDTNRFILLPP